MIFILFLLSLFNFCFSFTPNFIQLNTKITGVSINKAISHIHMPEHILTTHLIGAPFFTIHSVSNPIFINNISNIYFTCSILNLNKMFVHMHTKYTNRCEMNFYLNNKEFITLFITILPDLNNNNNHYFNLKVFLNNNLLLFLPIIKFFLHISMFITMTEDKLFYFNNNKKIIKFNSNMNKYRKFIYSKIKY